MEEDFPRGTGSGPASSKPRSKVKVKKPSQGATKRPSTDLLFKETEPEAPSKAKKKKKSKTEDEPPGEAELEQEFEAIVETEGITPKPLSQKTINEGMLVLAAVQEIHDYEVVLSLPNGLTAFVAITDVSAFFTHQLQDIREGDEHEGKDLPSLRDMVNVGDLMPCRIKSLTPSKGGHHRIQASLDYKEVNSDLSLTQVKPGMVIHGCVSSIEDHGFTIDLSIKGARAFLGKDDSKRLVKSRPGRGALRTGQLVTCIVKAVKAKGRSIILTYDPIQMKKAVATPSSHTTLSTLLPGTKVDAMLTKVLPNCLVMDVLGLYKACVDSIHLQDPKDELTDHEIGQKFTAVVLYNCPTSKSLGLSISKVHHKLTFDPENDLIGDLSQGDIIEEAAVIRVQKKTSVLVQLNKKTRGIVYHSQRSDDRQKRNSPLAQGETVRCRILGFNFLDRLAMVSMRKSVLDQPFLGIKDVQPGTLVKGVIETISPRGVAVKIQDRVRGFVPRTHLGDVPIQKPADRFSVGAEMELKVLLVELSKRRVLLTHKKTLVKSKLPSLISYTDPVEGSWVHGCIVAVKEFGCIVSFYNDVKGIIPRSELGIDRTTSPPENFYVGQVLKCRILRTHDPETKKLSLSLRKEGHGEKDNSFLPGQITKVKVTKVKPDGLDVSLLPGNRPAFIPKMHLSDHPNMCGALLASYSAGDVIDQAMTWAYNPKTRTAIVSCKPLLVAATRSNSEIVRDFSELQSDALLLGVLRHAMSYGVFVEFPNNIVGLAPKAAMSDEFISDTSKLFQVGQTLRAKVTEVDGEKKRFLVSLKASDCCHGDADTDSGLAGLEVLFRERERAELSLRDKKEYKHLISLSIGSLVRGIVRSNQGSGLVCSLPHGIDGVISQHHLEGNKPKAGESIEACVLHVDLASRVVTLSTKKQLIEAAKNTSKLKTKKSKEGKKTPKADTGSVMLVKEEFILVLSSSGQLVYLPAKKHLNDFTLEEDKLAVGKSVKLGDTREVEGRIVATRLEGPRPKASKKSQDRVKVSPQLATGQVVNAVVRSVKGTQVNVEVEGGSYGRIHATEVLDDIKSGQNPLESFAIGKKVRAKVIGHRHGKKQQHLAVSHAHHGVSLTELSIRPSILESDTLPEELPNLDEELKTFKPGQSLNCIVNKFEGDMLWVHVSRVVEGKVHRLNLSKNPSTLTQPETYFKPGQVHRAKVVRHDLAHRLLELSMSGNTSTTLEPGMVVNCRVSRIHENKVSVQLPFGRHGNLSLTDIRDVYVENPSEALEVNQYHRCCILEASKEGHPVWVSLRPSLVKKTAPPPDSDRDIGTLGDLSEGQIVRGYVKNCSPKGVFVSLSRNIHGRILMKHLSAFYVENPSAVFTVGKLIATKVLSIEDGKVELSSSSRDTGQEDPVPKDQRKSRAQQKKERKKRKREAKDDGNDSGLGEAEALSDTEAEIVTVSKKSEGEAPHLQLSGGFSWDEASAKPASLKKHSVSHRVEEEEEEESEEEEEEKIQDQTSAEPPAKKSKKDKQEDEKAEEDFLFRTERALMDSERAPETTDDFDRLVASSPNSSITWIRYMAFHLHSVDIEKARAIAERALKTINFREEQEKLNVWVAYLNLENLYGMEEDVVSVFQRALQQCEPIKVFQQLVSIYTRTSKLEQAEQLYESMIKRFKFDADVWTGFGTFLMKNGRHDQARRLMQRSLKSLIQKDHVGVIVKFAQLEYRHAEPERGKTMFENVLSNYPKRTDIWSIYLDMTIRQGETQACRHLFERVIHLNLSAKKVKFFFKRYLDFEKKFGDETTIQAVKQKAVEYVESKTAVGDDM